MRTDRIGFEYDADTRRGVLRVGADQIVTSDHPTEGKLYWPPSDSDECLQAVDLGDDQLAAKRRSKRAA